jgi:hypothetical protein
MTQSDPTQPERDPEESSVEEENPVVELKAEAILLERAIGGWRGLIDSGLPTAIFVLVYAVSGQALTQAIGAAVIAGVVIAVVRLVRREPLQQIAAGFAGLGIAAFVSWRTGRAEDFFLPGFLTNLGYGLAFLISILVRWPLLGVAMGFLTGAGTSWRSDTTLRRTYTAASWIWVGVFFGRLAVQVPLYLAGSVTLLGIAKVILGTPLFIAAAYVSYRLLGPAYRRARDAREGAATQAPDPEH